jgi:hypothetical protein
LITVEAIQYTSEALESLELGLCCVEDIDSAILNGCVKKKERDELKQSLDGWKYTFLGPDVSGYEFYCCGKLMRTGKGDVFLVITAHDARRTYGD